MNPMLTRRIRNNDLLYPRVWDLRESVLRRPLGLSLVDEDLGSESDEEIIIALQDGQVIGCVMLKAMSASLWKLRQMAVVPDFQGMGIGATLVREAEQMAREHAVTKITLHARKPAGAFYSKCGYHIIGDEFLEVGIPHLLMEKDIR